MRKFGQRIAHVSLRELWQSATRDQKARYLGALQEILTSKISSTPGEKKGVRVTVLKARVLAVNVMVTTIVERPNNDPAAVYWDIECPLERAPKIIDVLTDAGAFRSNLRRENVAFLSANGGKIDALIAAMQARPVQSG